MKGSYAAGRTPFKSEEHPGTCEVTYLPFSIWAGFTKCGCRWGIHSRNTASCPSAMRLNRHQVLVNLSHVAHVRNDSQTEFSG